MDKRKGKKYWFFYYDDYDGKVGVKKISKSKEKR